MGRERGIQHGGKRRRKPPVGPDEVRAVIAARLHRRGASTEYIAAVLGSSRSTVHRRLREMTPAVRAELEAADVAAVI